MPLTSGTRLGSYEIFAPLGKGGMGEVYRARDTKLDRDVALKILPEFFASDPDRLMRFEREAKTLASLNHPHIAQLHGLEDSDGVRALVMELVDGEDLVQWLSRGAMPLDQALSIARQVADALEAAHEAGIIHRDLKPANIKVRPDGTVKVLDFGLAKVTGEAGFSRPSSGAPTTPEPYASPTFTSPAMTQMGVILGTAAYMAPEQAKGQAVDKRADIWSFGLVLYEMLSGRRPFGGDDPSEMLAAVLRQEIDWTVLPAGVPQEIHRLLRRCLVRKPKDRLHDIADARLVIDEVLSGQAEAPAATTATASRSRMPLLLAGGGMLIVGLLAGFVLPRWLSYQDAAPTSPLVRFEFQAPADAGVMRGIAISPDGRHIAFAARGENGRTSLWVRSLAEVEPRQLPDTLDARLPFWAPDGRRLGFFGSGALFWTDVVTGGAPMEIAKTAGPQDVRGAAWGADDVIVFSPSYAGPLQRVSLRGGGVAPAVELPSSGAIGTTRFPAFLPDGRRFVFYAAGGTGTEPGELYLGRLGSLEIKRLGPAHSSAIFAAPGFLLYNRGEALVAHELDMAGEALVGEPRALGISMGGSLGISGLRSVSVSAHGILAYRADERNVTQLVWVDRNGRELGLATDSTSVWHYTPRISPDGRLIVVSQYGLRGGLGELWVHDIVRKRSSRITSSEGDDYGPLWVGPRELLYFSSRPAPGGGIYLMNLDRPQERKLWLQSAEADIPVAVTPEGRVILQRNDSKGQITMWSRDLVGGADPIPLTYDKSSEMAADISPDGRWLAYGSNASGPTEVYIRPIHEPGASIPVSAHGGIQPRWRADGRELYYLDPGRRLVAVPVTWPAGAKEPVLGAHDPLFSVRIEEDNDRQYDVSTDGQRFLVNRAPAFDRLPISVVLDWRALMKGPQ